MQLLRLGLSFLLLLPACGPDEFAVSDGRQELDGPAQPDSGGARGGDGDSPSGGALGTGGAETTGGAPAGSGGETTFSGWEGTREGPTLDEVDLTLGGYNQDLPAPEACPDLPESGCLELTGLVNGDPVAASCRADSFALEGGTLSCAGDWGSFLLSLSFSGPPPSKFALIAEDTQNVLGVSWDAAGFVSHQDGNYLLASSHEQKGLRVSGVRYELVHSDEARESFIAFSFGVHFLPRPTCPACSEVRLRGNLSAHLGQ